MSARFHLLPLLLAACVSLPAQEFSRLPDWAAQAARAAAADPEPADADAWVLLDRTEMAYTGDGEIRLRRFRVVKVLSERGTGQGVYVLRGLGGKANKVKRLKGWNLRPDSTLVKLDSDNVITANDSGDEDFSAGTSTEAYLERVVKGSYVAFESMESLQSPLGPVAGDFILERVPIRVWELEVAKKEGWFTNLKAVDVKLARRQFEPWITKVEALGTTGLRVMNLPPLPRNEGGHPHFSNLVPVVEVRFLDPALPVGRMWGAWDDMARWTYGYYQPALTPTGTVDLKGRKGLEGLRALWGWMGTSLTYKQVYLTPERGWFPETAPEVGRKRYGDCKDLTAFFLAEAKGLGFTPAPVLARIVDGEIPAEGDPFPVFNHVISGLKLEQSLGLPAEVETPKGRFLLTDPTDPFTPLGYLGSGHQGRRVMICLGEGAQWVTIPDRAILPDTMKVNLTGEVQGTSLKATLRLVETGDYWGLRAAAHRSGAKGVRELLMSQRLDLPATAQVEVVKVGEPLNLDQPFEVEVKVVHPEGFRRNGAEWEVPGWGVPYPFGLIQKSGVARQLPVTNPSRGELSFRAVLNLPLKVQPVLPSRTGDTPFRTFQWTASAKPEGEGTRVELKLEHRYKPATFGFAEKEKGLQAWKQDRSLVKSLREDGLALKAGS